MPFPHEIVAAPLTLYLAVVGTSFPEIDHDPTTPWIKLGTEGDKNYEENIGVTVGHGETVVDFVPAGSTMSVKRFRTLEAPQMSVNLVDLSPVMYALVMNDAEVTSVAPGAGTPGYDLFSLFRGSQVAQFAVIAKGESTIDNDLALQYEASKAFVSVDGDTVFTKGNPAMLPVKIEPIIYSDADVWQCRIQTAIAS